MHAGINFDQARPNLTHSLPGLNDVHARLNASTPSLYGKPHSMAEVFETLRQAKRRGLSVAIAGGRHAMGGQQFLSGGCVLDMRGLNRILHLDHERGLITVEAGATWPELMRGYLALQTGMPRQWGIRQKQTGADYLTIGGAIAANIHGRGLDSAPFAADVEALQLLSPRGDIITCSRQCQPELFSLVLGGYGLFGVVLTVTIRLVRRQKVQRVVQLATLPDIMGAFKACMDAGFLYGDFQFATDPMMPGFMRDGVFSCYKPVDNTTPIPPKQVRLSQKNWQRLLYLAHVNKHRAFMEFSDFYLESSGQIYWSDTHQLNIYLDNYHCLLDRSLDAHVPGTEMITELYVPRARLVDMMACIRGDFLRDDVDFIYGTIRLIRRDEDAFLKWAKDDYACVIFNLHVDHDHLGMERSRVAFQKLVDRAIEFGGSYFLTYHRHATPQQLLRCYPEFPEFLRRKHAWDPGTRFSSDWFRHYDAQFAGV